MPSWLELRRDRLAYQQIERIRYCTLVASVKRDDPAENTCAIVQLRPDGSAVIIGYQRAVTMRIG